MTNYGSKGSNVSEPLKKWLKILLVVTLCAFMLAGCNKFEDLGDDDTPGDQTEDGFTGTTTTDPSGAVLTDEEVTADNIFDFVLLGNYMGIEYDAAAIVEVSEDEVDAAIAEQMNMAIDVVEVTDRAVERGDTVTIDYTGSVDGVPFEGGTAEGAELSIGSGQFIPGFEEQIIGREIGEEFDIHVTFPDDYYPEELAGAAAVFGIVLHNIFTEVLPDLTDAFAMEYFGVDTVAQLRGIIRDQLKIDKEQSAEDEAKYAVWSQIFQSSTVLKYPSAEVDFRVERAMMEFYYYSEMYGMDVADLIYQMTEGMSYDDFINNEIRPGAITDVGQDLVLRAIGAKEGLNVSDEELQAGVTRLVIEYGYESEEQFLEINGENAVRVALLSDKVIELLMANAIPR